MLVLLVLGFRLPLSFRHLASQCPDDTIGGIHISGWHGNHNSKWLDDIEPHKLGEGKNERRGDSKRRPVLKHIRVPILPLLVWYHQHPWLLLPSVHPLLLLLPCTSTRLIDQCRYIPGDIPR
jgi:hypothetical protein